MFNFRDTQNVMDSSLFNPEEDRDLVVLIEEARTQEQIDAVLRMSRARMRARRAELRNAQRRQRRAEGHGRGFAPRSLIRGL